MRRLKRYAVLVLVCTLTLLTVPAARASAYDDHPKLIVIMVLDQFRADSLERYRADFQKRGFNLFLDHGAWFPDCFYDYANTETAPGDAAIGTSAYTSGNGIGGNSWWDLARSNQHRVTAVEDERYALVGLPAGAATAPGTSPVNLRASTLGDQLRLDTGGKSQVWGVSLKDDPAILATGAAANGAFWIDPVSGRFISSSYYMTRLPDWAETFDDSGRILLARLEANAVGAKNFYNDAGPSAAAVGYEFDFAKALIAGEGLGTRSTPDLLILSIPSAGISSQQAGHGLPGQRAMVDAIDLNLDTFVAWLDKNVPGGLGNVWLVLTADHGVAPPPSVAAKLGLNAARIDMKKLAEDVNYAINMKFSPGEKIPYLMPDQTLPYLTLNPPSFTRDGINEPEAEAAVQNALPAAFADLAKASQAAEPAPPPKQPTSNPATPIPSPSTGSGTASSGGATSGTAAGQPNVSAAPGAANSGATTTGAATPTGQTATPAKTAPSAKTAAPPSTIPPPAAVVRKPPTPALFRSYTRVELSTGLLPETPFGKILANSYTPNGGWYVMVIPDAFQLQEAGRSGDGHFTPYSYDRHVPLAFYGAPFAPGVYRGRVGPVDLASTLASLLGVNQPSASVGQILARALKPPSKVVYPKPPAKHHRKARRARRKPAGKKAAPKPEHKPASKPASTGKKP